MDIKRFFSISLLELLVVVNLARSDPFCSVATIGDGWSMGVKSFWYYHMTEESSGSNTVDIAEHVVFASQSRPRFQAHLDKEGKAMNIILQWDTSEVENMSIPTPRGSIDLRNFTANLDSSLTDIDDRLNHLEEGWMILGTGKWRYLFLGHSMTWQSARAECKNKGGRLATEGMRDTNVRLAIEKITRAKNAIFWVGLNDLKVEGQWKWLDDYNAATKKRSRLRRRRRREDCGSLGWKKRRRIVIELAEQECKNNFRAICEKKSDKIWL